MPTGSMAPTLLGHPPRADLPELRLPVRVGRRRDGPPARPVCPNCGLQDFDAQPAVAMQRRPRAGPEVPVRLPGPPSAGRRPSSMNPADPRQAYVKRVVGLPGESVRIVGGDVCIDGRSPASGSRTSGRCGFWSTTAATSRPTQAVSRAGRSARAEPPDRSQRLEPDRRRIPPRGRLGPRRRARRLARIPPLGPGPRAAIGPVRDYHRLQRRRRPRRQRGRGPGDRGPGPRDRRGPEPRGR